MPVLVKGLADTGPLNEDEIVTTILPTQYIEAQQAVTVLARMVSSYGTLGTLGKGQGIIITDSVVNIRRIQRLLQAIDQRGVGEQELKYYQLKIAPAADVAALIDRLFNPPRRQQPQFAYSRETGRYEPYSPKRSRRSASRPIRGPTSW